MPGKNNLFSLFLIFILGFFVFNELPVFSKGQSDVFSPLFFNEGIRLHKNGDFKNSISYLNKAIALNPNDVSAYLELASVYLDNSESENAVKILTQILRLAQNDPSIHLFLGLAYEKTNQLKEAIDQYKTVLELAPDTLPINALIGKACFKNNDYKCAINNLNKLSASYPQHLRSKLILAYAYHYEKDFPRAEEMYKEVLEGLSSDPEIWFNIAKVQVGQGKYENAQSSIDQAIALDNSNIEYYLDRAKINYKLSKLEAADNDYIVALKTDPKNPEIPIEYGDFLANTGAYTKAVEQYQRAIELQPDDAELYSKKAFALQMEGKYSDAIDLWSQVLLKEETNEFALSNLAGIYYEQKDYDNAVKFLKNLLSIKDLDNTSTIEAKSYLANSYIEAENFDEAKPVIDDLLKINPNNAEFLFKNGVLLVQKGNHKDAADNFKKAIASNYSDLTSAYKSLILCFEATSDISNVDLTYKAWLETDKSNFETRIAYAKFLARQGNSSAAIEQYRIAAALDNSNQSRFKLAQFLIEQKDYYGGIGQLHEYLKTSPEDINALVLLASAFKELGINEQAINAYKKIVSLEPDNYIAHFNLGLLYQQSKMFEEAENSFLKAIEINDSYAPAYYALGLSYMVTSNNNKAKEFFEKYIQLDPTGEYKEKTEAILKELNSKTTNPEQKA